MADEKKKQQDVTAGKGRRDEVGSSGVYPMSGPHPKGPAEIRTEPGWGQGERGAAGYEDHGTSEMTYSQGQVLGALSEDESAEVPEGEVPRAHWMAYFGRLSKRLRGSPVTIEIGSGAARRVEQQGVALDGIGADEKDRENRIIVSAGADTAAPVNHVISNPRRVVLRREGPVQVIEIESADNPPVLIRIGPVDVRKVA